jgi:hypothetical protein
MSDVPNLANIGFAVPFLRVGSGAPGAHRIDAGGTLCEIDVTYGCPDRDVLGKQLLTTFSRN